jgi:hypothetical protein
MTHEVISPLRWRVIEDMTIRRIAPKVQHGTTIAKDSHDDVQSEMR